MNKLQIPPEMDQSRSEANLVCGCNQIDSLHVWQRLAFLLDILNNRDTFGGNLMHLTAGGYHPHAQLIDNHYFPFALLLNCSNDIVHDLCKKFNTHRQQ